MDKKQEKRLNKILTEIFGNNEEGYVDIIIDEVKDFLNPLPKPVEKENNTKKVPKEEKEKEAKEKSKKGSGLIPKEKVNYPKELLNHPELKRGLELHEKGGSEGKKGRKILRKLGFKLSDSTTWEKYLTPAKKEKKSNKK